MSTGRYSVSFGPKHAFGYHVEAGSHEDAALKIAKRSTLFRCETLDVLGPDGSERSFRITVEEVPR